MKHNSRPNRLIPHSEYTKNQTKRNGAIHVSFAAERMYECIQYQVNEDSAYDTKKINACKQDAAPEKPFITGNERRAEQNMKTCMKRRTFTCYGFLKR